MKIEIEDISHGKDRRDWTYSHDCTLKVKNTDDGGKVTEKEEYGYMLQGADCIFLNAAKIYPPQDPDLLDGGYTPLLTEAQDIVGAINELFMLGAGGGDVYQVSGDDSGITVTMVQSRGENQELISEDFTFDVKTYTTVTTLSSGSTTVTKNWSKNAVSEVIKDGATVWKISLDENGNVTAVLDSVGNDVLNGRTGSEGKSVITSTPEGIALGWVLAYNSEQSKALQRALEAYQAGIDDCDYINEQEGVGGGSGSGDGDGDGSGGGGSGGSGGKLPVKSFGAMEIPILPGTEDAGSGAVYIHPVGINAGNGLHHYYCSHITIEVRGSTTFYIIHAPYKVVVTYPNYPDVVNTYYYDRDHGIPIGNIDFDTDSFYGDVRDMRT